MNFYRKIRNLLWRASMVGLDRGYHITRDFMFRSLTETAKHMPVRDGTVLSISDSANLIDVIGISATEITQANFPEQNILSLPYSDETFDFVLSDQVLEHVEGDPFQAIAECKRVLKPNGIAVHTTCFINPIHNVPGDFWRFTPDALALMHRDCSEIIFVGGWGNELAWTLVKDGIRYAGVPTARWHPVRMIAN